MKRWVRYLNYVVNLQKLNSRFYHFTPNRGRLQKSQTQETTKWTTESMRFNRMEPETSEDIRHFYSRLVLQADKCGFHCGDCGSSFQQRMIRDRLMLVVDKYLCTDILTLSDDPSIEEILSKSEVDQKFRTICTSCCPICRYMILTRLPKVTRNYNRSCTRIWRMDTRYLSTRTRLKSILLRPMVIYMKLMEPAVLTSS